MRVGQFVGAFVVSHAGVWWDHRSDIRPIIDWLEAAARQDHKIIDTGNGRNPIRPFGVSCIREATESCEGTCE
jgi:hypothetical protein